MTRSPRRALCLTSSGALAILIKTVGAAQRILTDS